MRLRTKLTVSLLMVAVAATASIGTFAYLSTAHQLNAEIDQSLRDVAAYSVQSVGDGGDGRGQHGSNAAVGTTTTATAVSQVQQIDEDGSVLSSAAGIRVPVTAADRSVAAGTAASYFRNVTIDNQPYRVFTEHSDRGAVQAFRPLAERNGVLGALSRRILEAAAVVIVASGLCGWLAARQITRRLSRLTSAAQTVASTGRFDVPVDDNARDEAGLVAAAFARMLEVLNRSQLAQRRFAQDAGHELRTPLTSLHTNLDVLARHPDMDDAQRGEIVADLKSETRELNVMVSELVDLTAGDTHTWPTEQVSLRLAAEHVVERARRRSARAITLISDESVALASWTAIERAVSNLIDNAVKFSPAGSPIEVEVRQGRVVVRDRGSGFADDDMPRVFDRFYRAASARSLPGSGLGLAIVHDVAHAFGGSAFAWNRHSGGAEVGFTLPRQPVPTLV